MSKIRRQGHGLIETLVVTAVIGILGGVAGPAMSDFTELQRLKATADTFRNDYQQARMLALGSGHVVRIRFGQDAGGSCYVAYQGKPDTCACSSDGSATCGAGSTAVAHLGLPVSRRIQLDTNSKSIVIEPGVAYVTPALSANFTDSTGRMLRHVVAASGRLRTCGSGAVGAPPCS